ncbi:unnamed protein product [Ectocarpus sp. 12 AP-2014]
MVNICQAQVLRSRCSDAYPRGTIVASASLPSRHLNHNPIIEIPGMVQYPPRPLVRGSRREAANREIGSVSDQHSAAGVPITVRRRRR